MLLQYLTAIKIGMVYNVLMTYQTVMKCAAMVSYWQIICSYGIKAEKNVLLRNEVFLRYLPVLLQ